MPDPWLVRVLRFVPGVVLALAPLIWASPAALLPVLLAVPLQFHAAARALGLLDEFALSRNSAPRLLRALAILLLGMVLIGLLLAWPAQLLSDGAALGEVILLCVSATASLLLLARYWPAATLPYLCEPSPGEGRRLQRCLAFAARLVSEAETFSPRTFVATLALGLLVVSSVGWGLAGGQLSSPWMHVMGAVYTLLWVPPLCLAVTELTARALVDSAAAEGDSSMPPSAESAATASATESAPAPLPETPEEIVRALFTAVRSGWVDAALELLQEDGVCGDVLPAADERDQRGLVALASILPDLRLLRALIERGATLKPPVGSLPPLIAATRDSFHGRPDAVMMLLANGADPRDTDADGRSPLHHAARSADPTVTALLLDAGAEVDALDPEGATALYRAAAAANLAVVELLLSRGGSAEPPGGQPVLLAAAAGGNSAIVRLLLRHRGNAGRCGRLGRTALLEASLAGHVEVVDVLLKAGADVDAADDFGVTPLLEATRAGANRVIDRLAEAAPKTDRVDSAGRSALVIACQSRQADSGTLGRLLALGVDPRQTCPAGRTPLQHALAAGRWNLVRKLDPEYALPASVLDEEDFGDTVAPALRLQRCLLAERLDLAAALLRERDLAAPSELWRIAAGCAERGEQAALDLLWPYLQPEGTPWREAEGETASAASTVLWAILGGGPSMRLMQRQLVQATASPSGRGGLAEFLCGERAAPEPPPDSEQLALDLLQRGADPFGHREGADPPAVLAVRGGHARLLARLLQMGVDPETRDCAGTPLLVLACAGGAHECVRELVAAGARGDAPSGDGQTARGIALGTGDAELCRWLDWPLWPRPQRALKATDLVPAAAAGDGAAVAALLDLEFAVDTEDAQGATALVRACGRGALGVARQLLDAGANPGHVTISGTTALGAATQGDHLPVVELLIERGADSDQQLAGGLTVLMLAAALGREVIVERLLATGADPARVDEGGSNGWHCLARFGFRATEPDAALRLWRQLAEHAGPARMEGVNAANRGGETPLLLLLGSDEPAGRELHEPALLAQIDYLLALGADLRVQDRRGFGPLHAAAHHGGLHVVRRLLAAGADSSLRDSLNRSAADLALTRGFVDVAREFGATAATPSLARFLRDR